MSEEVDRRDLAYTVEDGWIETYSGLKFHFLDPQPEEISLEDIAHALSLSCRYNGHVQRFYSVAEHSVLMTEKLEELFHPSPSESRTMLLHDAAEAYIGDMVRPLKHIMSQFKDVEATIDRAIAAKFGTEFPLPKLVKEFDTRILVDERRQAMSDSTNEWGTDGIEPLNVRLQFWCPAEAKFRFKRKFVELRG